jgi:hypothetical protein
MLSMKARKASLMASKEPKWSRCSGSMLVTDRHVRRELQEGPVRFVGLHHHPVALAHAGVGAVGVDDAAVDHRRVEAAGVEKGRDQRGGGGLAVGAGDGDAGLEAHQLRQHLGPPHHRQPLLAGVPELGIVALDRGRDHDELGAVTFSARWPTKVLTPFSARRRTL